MDKGIAMLNARQHFIRALVYWGWDHPITAKYRELHTARRIAFWAVRLPQPVSTMVRRIGQDNWN